MKNFLYTGLALAAFSYSPIVNAQSNCNWTGTWATNEGAVRLVQAGKNVTGDFGKKGTLKGTTDTNCRLTGGMDNHMGLNGSVHITGTIDFTKQVNTLIGTWQRDGYMSSSNWTGSRTSTARPILQFSSYPVADVVAPSQSMIIGNNMGSMGMVSTQVVTAYEAEPQVVTAYEAEPQASEPVQAETPSQTTSQTIRQMATSRSSTLNTLGQTYQLGGQLAREQAEREAERKRIEQEESDFQRDNDEAREWAEFDSEQAELAEREAERERIKQEEAEEAARGHAEDEAREWAEFDREQAELAEHEAERERIEQEEAARLEAESASQAIRQMATSRPSMSNTLGQVYQVKKQPSLLTPPQQTGLTERQRRIRQAAKARTTANREAYIREQAHARRAALKVGKWEVKLEAICVVKGDDSLNPLGTGGSTEDIFGIAWIKARIINKKTGKQEDVAPIGGFPRVNGDKERAWELEPHKYMMYMRTGSCYGLNVPYTYEFDAEKYGYKNLDEIISNPNNRIDVMFKLKEYDPVSSHDELGTHRAATSLATSDFCGHCGELKASGRRSRHPHTIPIRNSGNGILSGFRDGKTSVRAYYSVRPVDFDIKY